MVDDCCMILIILLIPPLGVFLMKGCGADFWINFFLSILMFLPGHLHAFYVFIKERDRRMSEAQGRSNVSPPVAFAAAPPAGAPAPVK